MEGRLLWLAVGFIVGLLTGVLVEAASGNPLFSPSTWLLAAAVAVAAAAGYEGQQRRRNTSRR